MKKNNHTASDSFSDLFEKTTGLTQWKIWVIVMVISTIFLFVTFYISQKFANYSWLIGFVLNLLICGLGVWLVYMSYQEAMFLEKETLLASEQVKILEEVDEIQSFLDRAKVSIFKSHIDNLYTISLSHPDVSQDNLIEILYGRLSARNQLVELFSSLLITLGLIGTMVGLIQMMGGLSSVMSMGAGDDLLKNIANPNNGPMAGLGAAFTTTLFGSIFGGVVLRVLTNIVDSSIMRYTAHLAELTEVHVLPYLRSFAVENIKKNKI